MPSQVPSLALIKRTARRQARIAVHRVAVVLAGDVGRTPFRSRTGWLTPRWPYFSL